MNTVPIGRYLLLGGGGGGGSSPQTCVRSLCMALALMPTLLSMLATKSQVFFRATNTSSRCREEANRSLKIIIK